MLASCVSSKHSRYFHLEMASQRRRKVMKQAILTHSWIGFVFCLVSVMLMTACTTVESPWVQLDQSVHFVTPADTDIVVKPGVYRVEAAGDDSEIQLLSEPGATPVVLRAESLSELSTPPDGSTPTAMIMIFEPETYDIVLRRPGRPALATHGSVSGVQSRGTFYYSVPSRSQTVDNMNMKGADLVGCIAHYDRQIGCGCFNGRCGCSGLKRYYYFRVTNLGNTTASQNTARFTNASNSYTYKVYPIDPGQTWKDYGTQWFTIDGWTEEQMGPKPWTYSVDVENVVRELNEGNNTSGECR